MTPYPQFRAPGFLVQIHRAELDGEVGAVGDDGGIALITADSGGFAVFVGSAHRQGVAGTVETH